MVVYPLEGPLEQVMVDLDGPVGEQGHHKAHCTLQQHQQHPQHWQQPPLYPYISSNQQLLLVNQLLPTLCIHLLLPVLLLPILLPFLSSLLTVWLIGLSFLLASLPLLLDRRLLRLLRLFWLFWLLRLFWMFWLVLGSSGPSLLQVVYGQVGYYNAGHNEDVCPANSVHDELYEVPEEEYLKKFEYPEGSSFEKIASWVHPGP